MTYTTSTLSSPADDLTLTTYAWAEVADPAAVVQISHGLAEHAGRYDRLATALNAAGYLVYAHDHRGHGATGEAAESLGIFGAAGWDGLVADLAVVGRSIAERHPDLPLFLIGHSMGSFALQQAIVDHSDLWAGVVLSGTTALDLMAQAMAAAAPTEGDPGASGDLSAFNAGFEQRTGFEWLSRDEAEVDLYVADPWCGFEVAPEVMPQLFGGAARLADGEVLGGIRKDLPILIVSGDRDPLAGGGALVETVGQRYRDAGVAEVTLRLFPEARHEIFNEINRDEVTTVVIDWLDDHTSEPVGDRHDGEDLAGDVFRECDLTGARFVDCRLVDVSLSGWMERLVVNDVDVTTYVWGELDRRFPERVQLRGIRTAADFRVMWDTIERLWSQTTGRAERLPESLRTQRVAGEWSFVETLRHLVFVTDAWGGRTIGDQDRPYDPLGLPFTAYPRESASAIGLTLDAEPTYAQTLAVRVERMSRVRRIVASLADGDLDRHCRRSPAPGVGQEAPSVRLCLSVLMDEEVQHRRYAERDLAVLESRSGEGDA